MNIEINDSNKTTQNKIKNHRKPTYSNNNLVGINNKVKGNENKGINVQSSYNILIPSKKFSKQMSKSKNIFEYSLKVKKQLVNKKEKEKGKENENEKENKENPEYHKIKTFNQKNNNHRNSNEELCPKSKKKSNLSIKKNPNENDILKLVTFANKVYEDEEHFQKNMFTKRDKHDPSNPNTKRSMYHHKRSLNEVTYKISKELLPESGNKNIHFRRRLSANKLRYSNDFMKSKKSSNCNLLKLKRNMSKISKENEDDTKILFDTQENNYKIKNYKFNNNDLDSKHLNSQKYLIKAKTLKHSKSKDYNSHKRIKEVKKEETINKSINKNNLIKANTQKTNNNKSNKSNKSQNQDLESIKKERKKLFKKYRNNYYCFLCCLKSKNDDSDNDA